MQYHRRQVGCKGLRVCVCGDIKRILKYEPFVLYTNAVPSTTSRL